MTLKRFSSYVLIIILAFYINLGNFMAYALSPNDISNKVFFLDGQDTDNDWNSANEPANNSQITNLLDKFNSNTGSQITSNKQPLYKTNSINSYPSLYFDGTNDLLDLKDNLQISVWTAYTEKSYAMIIKTSDDVNTFQTIYDEATKEKWFSVQIENWKLYVWAFNTLDWDAWKQIKTLSFDIQANEIYTVIFKFWNYFEAFLNWNSANELSQVEKAQSTHWACTFTTSFNCNIYENWWTLAIGSTKNDILKLSDWTTSTWLENNFFKWYIWEISSYNHYLTSTEVDWLNDYLFLKWWFDTTAPVIDSVNFSNNQILAWWNHDIVLNYSDSEVWATGIDTATANPYLEKWNSGTSAWENITASWLNAWTINTTSATYPTNNLDFWKYKFNFNIKDLAWNISLNKEITFYVDKPELIISTDTANIWELNASTNTFWDTITITVKTIWAWFNVKLKKNLKLTHNSDTIEYYDGTIWMWYDKNSDWNLSDYNDDIIIQKAENLNTDWNLNTYTYVLKMWAIINDQQASWNYEWKIDFSINLDY